MAVHKVEVSVVASPVLGLVPALFAVHPALSPVGEQVRTVVVLASTELVSLLVLNAVVLR